MHFDWDYIKAAANIKNHQGVTFEEVKLYLLIRSRAYLMTTNIRTRKNGTRFSAIQIRIGC